MPNVYPAVAGVKLKGQQPGAAPSPTWAAIGAHLPNVNSERLLVLGCGDGWICRSAVVAGAFGVDGVDADAKQIMRARAAASSSRLRYRLLPESRWSMIGGQYTVILITKVTANTAQQLSHLPRYFHHGYGSIALCGDVHDLDGLTEAIHDADRKPGSWRAEPDVLLPNHETMRVLHRSRIA